MATVKEQQSSARRVLRQSRRLRPERKPRTHWCVSIVFILAGCLSVEAQFGGPPASGQSPKALQLPLSGRPQNGSVRPIQTPANGANGTNSVNAVNPSVEVQGSYQGSVPTGQVSAEQLSLSLQGAIQRGIRYNLGAIGAGEAARQARAQRLGAMAELLPDLTANIRESVQQVNLVAEGLRIKLPIPGFRFPTVVGPFNYFDVRGRVTERFSVTGQRNWRSSQENARSVELSVEDSRELVALAVSGSYLQLIATAARIQTTTTQIDSARTVYQQALDRNKSGLAAHIDVSRTLVELQMQEERLTSLSNDFEKQKIALARLIGMPMSQGFTLSDAIPYRETSVPETNKLIQRSWAQRADVQAAAAQVKAAELARKAAAAEYYPSIEIDGDYGDIGVTPTNQSHGTFTATGGIQIPIFRSGRIRSDIELADAALNQRKAEHEDAKGRAEQDVRNAVLDLNTALQQIKVAESNRSLASDTLLQARDRFRAGVTDTVEVVQAQESVAAAEQDYITALYSLNLAQVSLARAVGETEQGIMRLLQGR